ncbi:NAD-dependent epimerase/dehydratase family protein [Streptomyces alboniger]|uniref:NAD-dependent epimerase/dehydratase family protein n=1 Tax=Streptomyces alboniger TaxID=132473 RepID=A0A5J6HCS1_STRAD|nr:NAD-dependent epimerase/dehydratase family protein [Streptomyces alboniger]QEV16171.1 NAD-dependent epimerase/dehydratase family protein [Streptomyces alboniger]
MQIIGHGFLARHLSEAFTDKFPEVTAIAAGVSRHSGVAPAQFRREAELVREVLRECGNRNRTVLFFSSASFALYGSSGAPRAEEDHLVSPPSAYGRSKLALESTIRGSHVPYLILRLSHTVGRYQRPHQLLPGLTRQVRAGAVRVQQGVHRDLLDVNDLLDAIGRLLGQGVRNEVLNVASGAPQHIEAILDGIEMRLGTSAVRTYIPGEAALTRVSIRRLQAYVPHFRPGLRSAASYLDDLLDAYLPYCSRGPAAEG